MQANEPTYICVDGVTYYELLPNSALRIGRTDANEIVLDDYKVSREHALVKYHGAEIVIIDLASTHGTFLNGERVVHAPFTEQDTVNIVSHELRLTHQRPEIEQHTEQSALVPAKPQHALDRRVKFFGGLNEFALITLVQFLHQEKQSGLLMLEEGQEPGPRMYFLEGEIIHVQQGTHLGDLLVRQHHAVSLFFYFHHETQFPQRTIHMSTPSYLMEMCREVDMQKVPDAIITNGTPTMDLTELMRPPMPKVSSQQILKVSSQPIPKVVSKPNP
jgi:hypothetical protein